MNEDIKLILDSIQASMQGAIEHLEKSLLGIRAGKANPVMLSTVMVDYYGTPTPLSQVANINTQDSRTLSIQPWEKQLLQVIDKSIIDSNLGFTPINKGDVILINIPPLTEERRKEMTKQIKHEGEETKISIRNIRQEGNKEIKKMEVSEDLTANTENDIQQITDTFIKKIDEIIANKEKEVMTI